MSSHTKIAALPLRQKIATLLQCDSYRDRVVKSDNIDYLDSIPRDIEPSVFEEFGISLDSMDASESTDDDASTYEVMVFRSGDRYVVGRVCYPPYCDDNTDGTLSYLTQEMSFELARKEVGAEFERVKGSIRARIKAVESNESGFLARLDELKNEPPIEAEVEEDDA